MSRKDQGLVPESCKIRKRGCSPSSSTTSSVILNYRFKKTVLVRKRGGGSTTPVPVWKLLRSSRSPSVASMQNGESSSPRCSTTLSKKNGDRMMKPQVSARKLAATLWEMNEVPSPSLRGKEKVDEEGREVKERRRSGSLPRHLSVPSHSPVSERMDRSVIGSRLGRAASISQKFRHTDHNVGAFDSRSSTSLMEIENRSRPQTPIGLIVEAKACLKNVSNTLTTSKELLKIINRVWNHKERPTSSMSLISALHAELERAQFQVNQIIHEQRSDKKDINYLMKCFAEEKAAWKNKEEEVVEAAIESIAGELDVEKKLRRRFESLNKKLGKELAEMKGYFKKAVKELENEKRAREVIEQVCDKLTMDIGEDNDAVESRSRGSSRLQKDVEIEANNVAIEKLRNKLEASLLTKRTSKGKAADSLNRMNDTTIASYLSHNRLNYQQNDDTEDDGEVEDAANFEEESTESDIHSIELNVNKNNNRSYKWAHAIEAARELRKNGVREDEMKGRWSISGRVPGRSSSLQRSVSDGVEWGDQSETLQRKDYGEEMQRYKLVQGLKDRIMYNSSMGNAGVLASPTRQRGQLWPSRDSRSIVQEKPPIVQGSNIKSRLAEVRGEVQNARRAKF